MLAFPSATPVSGKLISFAPAGARMVAGTVNTPVSELLKVKLVPPGGIGSEKINRALRTPIGAVITCGNCIVSGRVVTATVVGSKPGALADMLVVPTATPVTGKLAPDMPDGISTLAGTVAMAGSALDKLTVTPPVLLDDCSLTTLCTTRPLATVTGSNCNDGRGATVI